MTKYVGTPLRGFNFSTVADEAISARVNLDSHPRIRIDAGGKITWSDGASTGDTNLFRDSANVLTTDDVFKATGGVVTLVTNGAPTAALANGAIAIDTTNHVFYYRSNATWLEVSSGNSSITVSDTAPAEPESGSLWFDSTSLELLIYFGTAWVEIMSDSGAEELSDLTDINITSPTPGQVLGYDGTEWINTAAGGVSSINDLPDVAITSASSGQFLKWNGTEWVNDAIDLGTDTTGNYMSAVTAGTGISVTHTQSEGSSAAIALNATLDNLSDVTITSPTNGQIIKWNGTAWVNDTDAAGSAINSLDDVTDVTITSATSGQFLKWNGTAWVNDAIDLATDTTGSFVQSLVAGTGVTLSGNSGENATPTITVDTTVIQARVTNVTDTEIGYLDGVTSAIQTQIDDKLATSTASTTYAPIASPTFTGTVSGVTKTMVGLGSVDNTADTAKPVSTAQQTALDLKANLASPTFTGTVSGVSKSMVGLGSADNTSDANKPVSTATQTALDLKSNLASPTFTGTVSGISPTMVGLGNVDNTSDTSKPVSTAQQTALDLKAPLASPTFTGTVSGITKTMVGLGSVDNTADTAKPVSTAQQTALDLKANIASPTFTGTVTVPTPISNTDASTKAYVDSTASTTTSNASTALTNHEADTTNIHGIADTSILVTTTGTQTLTNKTLTSPSGLVKGDVGLGNVDNTADTAKPVSTAQQTALDLKAPLASPTLTGIPIAPTAAAGNNSTQIATTAYADAAVAAIVDSAPATLNTLNELSDALGDDANFATTTATAIGLKAPIASPTFTGTVSGVTASMVGLGSVDNTADTAKPVSTAQQTALDLKAPIASPTFTGTVTIPTGASITAPTGLVKGDVALGNVDNTSDANKPVSTAGQTALDLKANLASPTFTGTVAGISATMVGLGNVNNTSDTNKPVSTATQTALDLKANLASPTFTGTVAGISATMVGLGNVDNTSDANKPVSTAQQTALDLKANLASPTFTGTVSGITATMVGLGNVDNTSNATERAASATLTNKTLTSPVINTPTGIVKGDVGLSLVDNTADTAKPVSTATQTALDLKANLASPTFTGTVTIPSGASISGFAPLASPTFTGTPTIPTGTVATTQTAGNNTTAVATTAFVTDAVATGVAGVAIDSLDEITDVTITSVASGQFLKWNGTAWVNAAGGATISDTSPASPLSGQIWLNSLTGGTFVYYGTNWIEVGASPFSTLVNTINSKGDLLVGTADNTIGGLGVGSADQVLTVDSSTATGLKWSTPTTYATTGKAIAMAIVFGG